MMIERDGVRLAYDEAGTGETALLLVHGWGTDRSSLRPQFEALRAKYRVVAVDLRGFGESSSPAQAYSIEGYADDLAFLTERLGCPKVVVIGHSMGGLVALDFAARYPERVTATAVLEAFIAPSERALDGLRAIIAGLRGDNYRDFAARVLAHLLGPRIDPEERARMLAILAACPQHVLVGAFEGMLAYESRAAAARIQSPFLYVGTDVPYANEEELQRMCPQLVIERLSNCGHYFPLEVPDALGAVLARFLAAETSR
ncbi:putative alpha/beta hydrolase [Labilithrix luteola]|uniref:Putative alpha/beta hydrolase n=1 Tax=Labilithrix luteola TaxID=1391654 RepID=A0A0K1PXQ6_9BACT|nr:alpha/beta hydrolase [Labilithrix luteola]AKU98303.1 putative alpha/beta hydrolase [Labilithrix luteola]